jgi:replication initiation and membrane attachment protein DnaB
MSKDFTTISLDKESSDYLKQLAEELKISKQEVLRLLVDSLKNERISIEIIPAQITLNIKNDE